MTEVTDASKVDEKSSPSSKEEANGQQEDLNVVGIRNMVESATVLQFFNSFKELLDLEQFTVQDMEAAILNSENNGLFDALIRSILYLLLNRTKPLQEFSWEGDTLPKIVKKRLKSFTYYGLKGKVDPVHQDEPENPLPTGESFHMLDYITKVILLANMCDWAAEESNEIRGYIKKQKNRALFNAIPVGKDKSGIQYFYFSEGKRDCRMYSHKKAKKRRKTSSSPLKKKRKIIETGEKFGDWSTKCNNYEELESFLKELQDTNTRNKAHKEFCTLLEETIIPDADKKIKQHERAQRRLKSLGMWKTDFPVTRTKRTRAPVKYTYSSEDEFLSDILHAQSGSDTSQDSPRERTSTRTKKSTRAPVLSRSERVARRNLAKFSTSSADNDSDAPNNDTANDSDNASKGDDVSKEKTPTGNGDVPNGDGPQSSPSRSRSPSPSSKSRNNDRMSDGSEYEDNAAENESDEDSEYEQLEEEEEEEEKKKKTRRKRKEVFDSDESDEYDDGLTPEERAQRLLDLEKAEDESGVRRSSRVRKRNRVQAGLQ